MKTFLLWLHGCKAILWAIMIPVTVLTGLKDSIPFLVAISLWALTEGSFSAWQGVRAEMEVDKKNGDEGGIGEW